MKLPSKEEMQMQEDLNLAREKYNLLVDPTKVSDRMDLHWKFVSNFTEFELYDRNNPWRKILVTWGEKLRMEIQTKGLQWYVHEIWRPTVEMLVDAGWLTGDVTRKKSKSITSLLDQMPPYKAEKKLPTDPFEEPLKRKITQKKMKKEEEKKETQELYKKWVEAESKPKKSKPKKAAAKKEQPAPKEVETFKGLLDWLKDE